MVTSADTTQGARARLHACTHAPLTYAPLTGSEVEFLKDLIIIAALLGRFYTHAVKGFALVPSNVLFSNQKASEIAFNKPFDLAAMVLHPLWLV